MFAKRLTESEYMTVIDNMKATDKEKAKLRQQVKAGNTSAMFALSAVARRQ